MKIAICSSISFAKEIIKIGAELEELGHEVTLPNRIDLYAKGILSPETNKESTENKINDDLIRKYYKIIDNIDVILVINKDKNGIKNYIGGNTFLEIGFAHVLNKKIFLLNPVPDMNYSSEILAMEHTVINNDLSKII